MLTVSAQGAKNEERVLMLGSLIHDQGDKAFLQYQKAIEDRL